MVGEREGEEGVCEGMVVGAEHVAGEGVLDGQSAAGAGPLANERFQTVTKEGTGAGQLGGLGSVGESSIASRRKRAPAASRPRLSPDLALSMLLLKPTTGA